MRQENLKNPGEYGGGQHLRILAAQAISSAELWMGSEGRIKLAAFFTAVATRITNGGSSRVESLPTPGNLAQGIQIRFAAARAVGYALYSASPRNRAALAAFFTDAASKVPGGGAGGIVARRAQAMTGSFIPETLATNMFHAGTFLPVTNEIDIAAGSTVRVSFANKIVLANAETDGTGVLTLLAASLQYNGVVYPATLTVPTAAAGATAYYEVTVPVAIPKGAPVDLAYKISDGGTIKQFPWFSHSSTRVTKQVLSATTGGVPDQTQVLGGGTWTAVAGGAQSVAIVPCAIEVVHTGKVAAIMGSSTGVGRGDPLAVGAGVQGYPARGISKLGYPVKNLAVSGDRISLMAAGSAWRRAQLTGVTHLCIVAGGNDITAGATAAATITAMNTFVAAVKADFPTIKIMVVTLNPVVTGTYATLGGQTKHATNDVRVAFNTTLKAGLVGVDLVYDVNVIVENIPSPEDGLFSVANGQITNDGLHINSAGCTLIENSPIWAAFMAM